jgi:hypothetical protein
METKVAVGFFDGAEIPMDEPETPDTATALTAFLGLTSADRQSASRHVHAYYLDVHEAVGGEDWLDAAMGVPANPEAIWDHVHPRLVFTEHDRSSPGNEAYVVVECDCDWEEEHGLMLCFREGQTLTKCGGYDGHVTNCNAYADDSLLDTVYYATNPKFTTREDP